MPPACSLRPVSVVEPGLLKSVERALNLGLLDCRADPPELRSEVTAWAEQQTATGRRWPAHRTIK